MEHNGKTSAAETTRRELIGAAAASVVTITIVPAHVLGGPGKTAPSEKLNIACIGVGGRGYPMAMNVSTENIAVLCDVDEKRASRTFEEFPKAKRYHDYRRMLDKEAKSIDAVVICTTDHVHVPASVAAMRLGKHVYCEKPLGHNIHEVRYVTELADKTKLVTQMGNESHSGYNYRSVAQMIKAGTIGQVREAHCWCDQAWPPGDRPKATPPVPKHLKWDLWLGPAPERPYHPCYHPQGWRYWWDFGNGRIGDMGCHMIDLPFMALGLRYPLTVETRCAGPAHKESAPGWMITKWTFPKRGKLPPVELNWYDGGKRPPLQKRHNMPDWPEATMFVGTEGLLIADYGRFKLFPEDKFAGVRRPRLERMPSHAQDWIAACKAGKPTRPGCHFGYAGPLAETVLLGTVAYRAGRKLEWDPIKLKATNYPEADRFLRRENRKGWEL